ncbi:gamma-glutamyltransferase [Advenella mimigardefordensis]|uniref:Glutathione hydrolase proenzyme n=1 Tax=Advenella mimigardefordensis (strain DSM 17166 / LMG 22922 / DPN7) TaxID=1247726 RepID=W0PEA2_ADVMD|nr:gamma-glutamyltransferase [Advenella mimigardefordensis]AHG65209.1 putative gamma-glutamyltransferase [Advenella mimigardefordensis DPN7]
MRHFELPGRPISVGAKGMVATSNPAAAQAGLDILRSGGNAVDAAVAVAAMLAVVEPTQTGIGGDCFVLLKKRGQPPVALSGAGWAPQATSAAQLRESGLANIPADNVHAVTVPGAVRAWEQLLGDHGTRPLNELFHPAIVAAEDGYLVTERLARDWARSANKVCATPQAKAIFMPDERSPVVGDRRFNPKLGRALRSIARDGADVFYEGWIAEDIVTSLQRHGGVMQLEDLADYHPEYVQPISTDYRGYRLWECPPSGQGIVALQIAAMLNRFDLSAYGALSTERFHLQAEVSRIAYAERDAFLCDPKHSTVDVEYWLSARHIDQLVARISLERRIEDVQCVITPEHKDTVFISVADADGTVVAFINSLFDDFGSGLVACDSGVLLHNRGCGFTLEAGHPNEIAGRKRPMHTIIPALLTKGAEAVMSFGVTGGHFQPAGQLQVLSNIVDYGLSIQQAIEHPRMLARGDSFELESTVPESIWAGLRQKGHAPVATENPLGTCHAIWLDHDRGVFMGGSDGRRDGMAIGF